MPLLDALSLPCVLSADGPRLPLRDSDTMGNKAA